eukprot:g7387.t1
MSLNGGTSRQPLLEAGPSRNVLEISVEGDPSEGDGSVDVSQTTTLSEDAPKPRPLNIADNFEIVGGVPAFVWRTKTVLDYAISFDGTRIAIRENWNEIW